MQIKTFKGGYDNNFSYLLIENQKALLLDSALSFKIITDYLEKNKIDLIAVVILHSHFDHIVDLDIYREKRIWIWAHESTKIDADKRMYNEEKINFEGNEIKVLHTPGHIYDAICLKTKDDQGREILFTSDTLFVGTAGRVDLPGSDPEAMKKTMQRLKQLPDEMIIYPGHDYGNHQNSTIKREKKENPFLSAL